MAQSGKSGLIEQYQLNRILQSANIEIICIADLGRVTWYMSVFCCGTGQKLCLPEERDRSMIRSIIQVSHVYSSNCIMNRIMDLSRSDACGREMVFIFEKKAP